MMKKILLLVFLIFTFLPIAARAEPKENLKASFVRDNLLWLKIKDKEIKITDTGYVREPRKGILWISGSTG
ncbi:hypothetical protein QFZ31_003974 [Neobacillus niacini]|uniref:hypothetical protein n=1 Tax=Neobacillus driksii TaxID=3035913 RepID=UPI0027805319|nr:hypothetical protein [Neobacillus niacini]MDQ0974096.1 hypothetical protein [Neobacillus niacini]